MRTFAQALAEGGFTVTAEIPLTANLSPAAIRRQARELAPAVDGIQFSEHPRHRGLISPVALAALLLGEEIDPIVRLNCRDRNRLALRSELAGLRALGASSLILNRGNRVENPGALDGKPVFEVNCRELIAMAVDVGEQQPGAPGQPFLVGTGATVFRPKPGWKAELYRTRARAGARFLQTQPCFSMPMLRQFMQRLVDRRLTWNCAVIVTLAPLPGMAAASWQFEDAQGTVIPRSILAELAEAEDPAAAGIGICARQMREVSAIPGVSGVNLLTLGNPAAVLAAIAASGLRMGSQGGGGESASRAAQ